MMKTVFELFYNREWILLRHDDNRVIAIFEIHDKVNAFDFAKQYAHKAGATLRVYDEDGRLLKTDEIPDRK